MAKKTYRQTKINEHALHPETQMMSYGYDPFMSEGAVKPPVFLTSTFAFRSAEDGAAFFDVVAGRKSLAEGESTGLVYSRFNHPNLEIIEDRLGLLASAEATAVLSSGMAAISAVCLAFLRPGQTMVHSTPLYGGTETLIRKFLDEFGIASFEFQDGLEHGALKDALANAATSGEVRVVYLETPANPTNALIDFEMVAHTLNEFEQQQGYRPTTVCDNTLIGPVFQKPLLHGIDISVYSLTKYVGGHSDLVAGGVCGKKNHIDRIRTVRSALGMQLDPHSSWMIARSLETLVLRMTRAATSAAEVAQWLSSNPHHPVTVLHPDFIDDLKYRDTYQRQCSGAGSTFSFVIGETRDFAFKVINGLSLFKSAVSLGGTESLVCHPASTTHSGVSENIRARVGVSEGLIRVSIGLEHPSDLIADLDHAIRSAVACS